MRIDPNAPAFPTDTEKQVGPYTFHHAGMTIRAVMATKILAGLVANPTHDRHYADDAKSALKHADALIAELNQGASAAADTLEVCKQVEWAGTDRDEDGSEFACCPWCGEPKPDGESMDPHGGHLDNCRLYLAIAKAEGKA